MLAKVHVLRAAAQNPAERVAVLLWEEMAVEPRSTCQLEYESLFDDVGKARDIIKCSEDGQMRVALASNALRTQLRELRDWLQDNAKAPLIGSYPLNIDARNLFFR